MEIQELLRLLCTQMSVSGSEYTAKKTLFDTFGAYFDEQFETPLGSLIFVRRSARPNAPKLMVDAHFDEVGMLVSEILPDGFLRAANLGRTRRKSHAGGRCNHIRQKTGFRRRRLHATALKERGRPRQSAQNRRTLD